MTEFDLLNGLGDVREDYVLAAREAMLASRRRVPVRRLLVLAAIISLMVFLLGCAVVMLRLQDLKIGEDTGTRYQDENGDFIQPTEVTRDVISLRGYKDSANYSATKEWYEFDLDYDPDHTLLFTSFREPEDIPAAYAAAYGCYTRDMVDMVDRIAEKHGLKLLGPMTSFQRWQNTVMFDAMGISGVCRENAAAYIREGAGYFFAEGNFKYSFDFTLKGEDAAWPYMICANVLYSRKDYFDPAYTIVDTEWYEQWSQTLSDGTQVLIAMGREGALLFAEQEDAYITVTLDTALMCPEEVKEHPSREAICQAAEVIDFALKPCLPDMTEIGEKLAQADREYERQREAEQARAAVGYDSYGQYIRENFVENIARIAGTPEDRTHYALVDADGDGTEDLLLGRGTDTFVDILTMKAGKVAPIHRWCVMTLCEGNVLQAVEESERIDGRTTAYHFYRLSQGEERHLMTLHHEIPGDTWYRQEGESYTEIPSKEAEAILAGYVPVPVELKPIGEFPG